MELGGTDQRVLFGPEVCREYLARDLSISVNDRILLISGKGSFEVSGAMELLKNAVVLEQTVRFFDFNINPTYEDVQRGLDIFYDVKPAAVLAVGGGSVLDMAKLIRFFGASGLPVSKRLGKLPENVEVQDIPLIAVPTTAGTGSEATCFSVMYKDKVKYSVEHDAMLPDVVLLIPELTEAQSPYQTACSGYDAFAQAVESYWAVGATHQSQEWAAKAIDLCLKHLENAVLNPSADDRKGMLLAAHWAGRAINISKTTAAHAMSYALTSYYGVPHGHAVALLLPHVFKFNAETAEGYGGLEETIKDLCGLLNCGSVADAFSFIKQVAERTGLGMEWAKASGVNMDEVRECIVNHVNLDRLTNNPSRLSLDDIGQIASCIG